MEYRYLKAFLATAITGSFSKAAKELNIAQSAVSRQIKLIEESMGEELIIRSSKKVILTEKGKELFFITKQFDEMANELFTKEESRTIRVGILDGLVESWFTKVLIEFYKKNINNIKVSIDTPSMLKGDLEQGLLDFILTTENIQSEIISSLKLFPEKQVLISKEKVDLKNIHNYRWIVFSEDDPLFKFSTKKSKSIVSVDSMNATLKLVKNNVGIGIVPDHILRDEKTLVKKELTQFGKTDIYMATLNFKTMPEYLKNLSDVIVKNSK